ncbi:hypothetical protein CVT26_006988 [Gymnopilus dilepis]|uniref:Uncharacterized protein n=1 Tax=Gymnopilus dilepis TaxID=231916 RepID=A0A409W188_9AGAR|nr:hypothetical protein CVT26_006988 [Gymnopilus dilepis]
MACEPTPKVLVTLTLYMLKLSLWIRRVPLASSEPAVLADSRIDEQRLRSVVVGQLAKSSIDALEHPGRWRSACSDRQRACWWRSARLRCCHPQNEGALQEEDDEG